MDKKRLIKLIHIAMQQLHIDDASYRVMLNQLVGKSSSKTCTLHELEKIYTHLKSVGFKLISPKRAGKKPVHTRGKNGLVLSKIEALLAENQRPWSYAQSMAKHMFKIDKIEWLMPEQLNKLLQALIIDSKRRKVRGA